MAEPVLTQSNPIYHEATEGGVRYSPASAHSKEMAKWEMRALPDGSVTQSMIDAARRAGVHHGAFDHQEYPKAMVKYGQTPNGIKMVENVSAQSEIEERNLFSRGFRMKASDAIAYVEAQNDEIAAFAANRAFSDRRMTAQAQAEAEAIDVSTARHLAEIPAAKLPPKKRGRKPKAPAQTES